MDQFLGMPIINKGDYKAGLFVVAAIGYDKEVV